MTRKPFVCVKMRYESSSTSADLEICQFQPVNLQMGQLGIMFYPKIVI